MIKYNIKHTKGKPYWYDPDTVNGLPNVNASDIEKVAHISNISYECFFTNYMKANKPCILSSSFTENWKSRSEWITSDGKPNFIFLEKEFGSSVVPVSDCNNKEYNSQHKEDMVFRDYLNYWRTLNCTTPQSQCLYLKDWHFQRHYPNYEAYTIPEYFSSDWLNEFCGTEKDDYKFVYMGPKNTWTPLHADVYGSYSWSTNIGGRKRWVLFPPGEEEFLKDKQKNLPYFLTDDDLIKCNVSFFDIIQEAGEIIFVPSGWYHQVWNIEDTISINHNWFNSCNIHYIWHCLHKSALDVEKELSDCKSADDWENMCQDVLKELHGLDYENFLQILKFIFEIRSKDFQAYAVNWLQLHDIMAIESVCSKIISSELPEKVTLKAKILKQNVIQLLSKTEEKYHLS
ncbi:2-oxoglutarate and iron-dependent oxygenase JMJD4 [Caerostris darwini]|uniref:2-oxoglutarate and iron-dependent oxygenase JMJD4 n=1 Tax=Caerostris darwini TaxID=1538125 RepID=A0AAV4PTU8_9ARAC|nr:2-oxoglutarate and iron-dependent oxygenase JMJD4 [Caerostris darwini]